MLISYRANSSNILAILGPLKFPYKNLNLLLKLHKNKMQTTTRENLSKTACNL